MVVIDPNAPAFPVQGFKEVQGHKIVEDGLTIRAYFAGLAMQGILTSGREVQSGHTASSMAVMWADALIAALNKKASS